MSEPQQSETTPEPEPKFGWNWIAIWWYFVISLCGATIAAYTMGQRVLDELAKRQKDPQAAELIAQIREGFDRTTTITSYAALAALIISGFLLPKFYGQIRKK